MWSFAEQSEGCARKLGISRRDNATYANELLGV